MVFMVVFVLIICGVCEAKPFPKSTEKYHPPPAMTGNHVALAHKRQQAMGEKWFMVYDATRGRHDFWFVPQPRKRMYQRMQSAWVRVFSSTLSRISHARCQSSLPMLRVAKPKQYSAHPMSSSRIVLINLGLRLKGIRRQARFRVQASRCKGIRVG